MPRRGQQHSPEALERIARGTRWGMAKRAQLQAELDRMRAALYAVGPADLDALRTSGLLSDSTAFCADVAAAEVLRLRRAVEGEPSPVDGQVPRPLSAQRVARLGRAQRLLTLGLACQARALTAGDRESAATAGQLLAKADALLVDTLGLETEVDALGLDDYRAALAGRARSGEPNGEEPPQASAAAQRTEDAT